MNSQATAKTDNLQLAQPGEMEEAYPQRSMRKIAVLFTDVVGSTRYFKELGDVAGREMLRQHQDIASGPIAEHGGMVVKTLGDSVLAYFMDPKEAVKSAVKIQQRFLHHNRLQSPDHRILVRIGIHFGDGIVEDQDIFGNVVNLAAKIVSLAGRDQIFVSEDVQKKITHLSLIRCEQIPPNRDISDLEGVDIFQILWDETIHFDPTTNILLFLKPLWKLAGTGFKTLWTPVVDPEANSWKEKNIRVVRQDERFVILVFQEITAAVDTAHDLWGRLTEKYSKNRPSLFLPVQILVDSGPYLRADKLVLDNADFRWNEINPGDIYISSSALRLVKNKIALPTAPPFDYDQPRPVYRMVTEQEAGCGPQFMYRNALIDGRHPVCFYCGSRKHAMAECPSKKQVNLTQSLSRLGYLPVQSINSLFLNYLNPPSFSEPTPSDSARIDDSSALARQCFYELKTIVQIRFFRNLWDSFSGSWSEVKSKIYGGEKGGQIWLALDLIRTSRLGKAESLLNSLALEKSQDYKVFCMMGFLHLEKTQFRKAESSFDRALLFVKTKPQRIFILFLLSRLFEMRGNLQRAEEKIDEILLLQPSCADARYQRMLYRFYKGRHKRALADLSKLIPAQKEFYVKALIDPELAPFSDRVDNRLQKILEQVAAKAREKLPAAESAKKRLESLLGDAEFLDDEIRSMWKKADEAFRTESYSGYLDAIHFAALLANRCLTAIMDWKKRIEKHLSELNRRILAYTDYLRGYPFPFMTLRIRGQLHTIQNSLQPLEDVVADEEVGRFKEAYAQAVDLSVQMDSLTPLLKRLEFIRKSVYFLSSFFEVSLRLQTLNLLIGIILLPVVSHYVTVVFPELKSFNQKLWLYQKGYLIGGGVFAFLLAIIKSLKKFPAKP